MPQTSPPTEGLRERKKRRLRDQLSDTATRMFVEKGFAAVRVKEVADACDVSEATVFNYFPTKEALVLDRLEDTMTALRGALAATDVGPIEAALRVLDDELKNTTDWLAKQDDPAGAAGSVLRFGDLIRSTPSLRAYQSDMVDQCVSVAAEVLASVAGAEPEDPEPQIAARAIIGLWHVQALSLRRHLRVGTRPAQIYAAVIVDVRRAAQILTGGLRSFHPFAK